MITEITEFCESHPNVTEVKVKNAKKSGCWAGFKFIYVHLDRENIDGSDFWNLIFIVDVDEDSENVIVEDNLEGFEGEMMNEDVMEWLGVRLS